MSKPYSYFLEHWAKILDPKTQHVRLVPELDRFEPGAKKILCLVPLLTTATWYRLVQPFYQINTKHKDKYNITFTTWIEAASALNNPELYPNLKFDFDCIIYKSQDSPEVLHTMQALKKFKVPIIYEVDDDLFNIPEWNVCSAESTSDTREVIKKMLCTVDKVVTSTVPLKELYTRYQKNIDVIPNGIDLELFGRYKKTEQLNKIVIGWTGSQAHLNDLLIISKVIPRILNEHANTMFLLGGWSNESNPLFRDIPEDRIIRKGWTNDLREHYQNIAQIDIGVCPIVDCTFNKSKSNLKTIEMNSLGIPTVCSNVYPYANTITDGVNGLLANTEEDWYQHITHLVTDIKVRQAIGIAAKTNITEQYTQDQMTQKWLDLFDKMDV